MDKLLLNPIRLKVISTLANTEFCNFNFLLQLTESSKGNLSVQLKKLKENRYIKIHKSFKNNYPNTNCSITDLGRDQFNKFINSIISLKQ